MKNFKSIEEWLKSKPTSDELTKVLNFINRRESHNSKVEYYEKEKELRKLMTIAKYSKNLNLKMQPEIEKRLIELSKEVPELKKSVWPDGKKKRSKKLDSEVDKILNDAEKEGKNIIE